MSWILSSNTVDGNRKLNQEWVKEHYNKLLVKV